MKGLLKSLFPATGLLGSAPACFNYLFVIESQPGQSGGLCDSIAVSDTSKLSHCYTQQCDTLFRPIILSDVTVLPPMFGCGYVKPCLTCDSIQGYVQQFRTLYTNYAGAPYMSIYATTAETEINSLLARFINYKTGFSKNAAEYIAAYKFCGLDTSCNGELTAPNVLTINARTAPYRLEYIARVEINMLPNFESINNDEFLMEIRPSLDTCDVMLPGNTIAMCASVKPLNDITQYNTPSNPCEDVETQASFMAQQVYQLRKDSLIAVFDSLYLAKCLGAKYTEEFYVRHLPKEYHYTLYYYDQAGNLVKTLPPAAVKPNHNSTYLAGVTAARNNATDYTSTNTGALATHYRYNTLNQVMSQRTPDAGISKFWYDRLGRLVVSQNAKQAAQSKYSYTLYDYLGRITQVGQKPQSTVMLQSISVNEMQLENWLKSNGANTNAQNKEEITRTVYDVKYFNGEPNQTLVSVLDQLNLRNRVSYTQLFDQEPIGVDDEKYAAVHQTATYYSYDIHGNVA